MNHKRKKQRPTSANRSLRLVSGWTKGCHKYSSVLYYTEKRDCKIECKKKCRC